MRRITGRIDSVREKMPLVHCLTNPITSYHCANIILAAGGRPIMAEHPREVSGITAGADALLINLGNIQDSRMQAMRLAADVAAKNGIPVTLDAVGVGCSKLRLDFALELIKTFHPAIVKGNRAEIAALTGHCMTARGVDAEEGDLSGDENLLLQEAGKLSARFGCVVAVSGPVDIITDGAQGFLCENGSAMMGRVCGTGCMLGALTAAHSSCDAPLDAALLAFAKMGIAGEIAAFKANGPGSFAPALIDIIFEMTDETLLQSAKIREG